MFKKITFLFFVLSTLTLKAQEAGDVQLGINANYIPWSTDKDFEAFQKGYETVWGKALSSGFQQKGIPFNLNFSISYWLNNYMGLYLNYGLSRYRKEVNFSSGDKRVFEFSMRQPFEGGFCLGNPKRVYVNLIFGFGTSTFSSIYYYKNGERDMNYNSPLNGVYSASGFTYRFELAVNVFKNWNIIGSIGGIAGSEYSDKNFMKGIDAHGAYETSMFPVDYELYNTTANSGASYEFPYDKYAKLKNMNVTIGLKYNLKLFNKAFNF
jgi:hypothetical protein